MLYSYFFNMLKVGVPGATQVPQLLVYNQIMNLDEACHFIQIHFSFPALCRTDGIITKRRLPRGRAAINISKA